MPGPAPSPSSTASSSQPTSDPNLTSALGLGWQMAELYQEVGILTRNLDSDPPDLPGLSALGSRQLIHLRFDQILSGLCRLSDKVKEGGLSTDDLKTRATQACQQFGPVEPGAAVTTLPISTQQIRQVILDLHVRILDTLTSVDASVGKAYGLGRALADLTIRPNESSQAALLDDFDGRIDTVKGWLRDLKTLLPDHASMAVRLSLDMWQKWIQNNPQDKHIWTETVPWSDSLHPNSTLSVVTNMLYTQGTRWRSILTGEMKSTDILGTNELVLAGEALLQRVGAIGRRFLRQFWLPLSIGIVVLAGIVAILVIVQGGSSGGLGALGAIAAAAGFSWKGIESSLGTAVRHVEPALWGAELDLVVAVGITTLPGAANVELDIPKDKRMRPNVGIAQSD